VSTRFRAGASVAACAAIFCTLLFFLDRENAERSLPKQEAVGAQAGIDSNLERPPDLARSLDARDSDARTAATSSDSLDPPSLPPADPPLQPCAWMPMVMCFNGGQRTHRGYRLRREGRRQLQIEAGWAENTVREAQMVALPQFTDLEPGSYELIDWNTGARVGVELNSNCEGPQRVEFTQAMVTYVAIYVTQTNRSNFDGGVTIRALHGDFQWKGRARHMDSGVFEAFLPPGDYEFTALGRDLSRASTTASVAESAMGEVFLEVVHVERFHADFEFRLGDAASSMPSSWCHEIEVTSLEGSAVEARIGMRPASIPGASLAESLRAGIGGLTISTLQEGSSFVSFPALQDGTVLEDLLVDFGASSGPAHVIQVGSKE
jgi:hypothetical protein